MVQDEAAVEKRLADEVKKAGGICFKFTSPGFAGVPDRIVLLPGAGIAFVEAKAPGQKPRKLQVKVMSMIRALGFRVEVVDSKEGAVQLVQELLGEARE